MPEVSDLSLQLGKYIQTARDARGLTQEKVGEMIGRTGKSISNIARGKTNHTPVCVMKLNPTYNFTLALLSLDKFFAE